MKILIIGLGGIGQRHVRNLRTVLGDEAEFLAYRVRGLTREITPDLEIRAGGNVEAAYGVRVFRDLDAALRERPACTFICNPSSLHLPVALAAARAGCHLFVEKPLSHSTEGIADLIAEVERQGRSGTRPTNCASIPVCARYAICSTLAPSAGCSPCARRSASTCLPGTRYEDYRQMYAARRDLGGGVILSQIHEMDFLYWFFGAPRRIVAMGGHLSSLEIDVEDVASILMECVVDGTTVPVHLHADYVQRPGSRTCQIIGDAGKILLDLRAASVRQFDSRGEPALAFNAASFERNTLFLSEIRHFLACMRGEETPLVSLRDGLQSLRMALAARESLETGSIVTLT